MSNPFSNNTVITKIGIDQIAISSPSGPLVAIKYCIPVQYDLIDTDLQTGMTSAIAYSATIATTSASTYPIGQRIWNTSGNTDYSLSQKLIASAGTITHNAPYYRVNGYNQSSVGVGMNLYKGVPLQDSLSAGNLYPPTISTNYWQLDDSTYAVVTGVNTTTTNDRSKYWKVNAYYPTVDDLGNIRGTFIINIDNAVGRFRFNKIALYVVTVDVNGNEDNLLDAPIFFAECFVKETCVKSNILNEGFDSVSITVDMDIEPLGGYWPSGIFSNSANDWNKTIGGVYYSSNVGVGSFSGSTDEPQATMHLRHTDAIKPILRLDSRTNPNTNYITFDVNASNTLIVSGAGLSATSGTLDYVKAKNLSATVFNCTDGDFIGSVATPIFRIRTEELYATGITTDDIYATIVNADNLISYNENYIKVGGGQCTSAIPFIDNIFQLGALTSAFKKIYTKDIITGIIENNGTIITLKDDIIPETTNDNNLGSYNKYFNSAFINNLYTNGNTDALGNFIDIGGSCTFTRSAAFDYALTPGSSFTPSEIDIRYSRINKTITLRVYINCGALSTYKAVIIYLPTILNRRSASLDVYPVQLMNTYGSANNIYAAIVQSWGQSNLAIRKLTDTTFDSGSTIINFTITYEAA